MAALFQEAQRVPKVPRATGNDIFLSPRGEGVRLCVQRMSMESLVCCWLQLCFEPALNFLWPGSGLGKYSRGSLWYCQAELLSHSLCLGFYCSVFPGLFIYIFFCSPVWFTATSPVPGRHKMIFQQWKKAAPWFLELEVTGIGSTTIPHFSQLSCQQELCFLCRILSQEVREGENSAFIPVPHGL